MGRDRWCSAGVLLAIAICATLTSATASAQDAPNRDDEIAKSLFEAGRVAFDAGRYDVALDSWLKAYDQSRRPQLLYNLGLASDRLRRDETALGYYKRYLHELPDAENRVEAENRIRALEKARVERATTEPPTLAIGTPAPESAPPSAHMDKPLLGQWWFWTAASVVVAAVVVGVVVAQSGDSVGDPRPGTGGLVVVALSGP